MIKMKNLKIKKRIQLSKLNAKLNYHIMGSKTKLRRIVIVEEKCINRYLFRRKIRVLLRNIIMIKLFRIMTNSLIKRMKMKNFKTKVNNL